MVGAVAVAMPDAPDLLHEQVEASTRCWRAGGVEGEHFFVPAVDGAGESGQLGMSSSAACWKNTTSRRRARARSRAA